MVNTPAQQGAKQGFTKAKPRATNAAPRTSAIVAISPGTPWVVAFFSDFMGVHTEKW